MKSRYRALRLSLAFAMIAAFAFSATAATAHSPGDNVNGVVTAKTATTLTVLAENGTSSAVTVTAATVYRLPHRLTGTFDDVLVGSRIKVEGTLSGTVLTAAVVKIKWNQVNGVVTAVSGSSLTVLGKNGTSTTVIVTATTIYRLPHRLTGTAADVAVGSRIRAEGTLSSGILTARLVTIKWAHVNGVVTALSPLTVTEKNGTSRIILITGATVYRGHGHASAVLGDIHVGSRIKAEGTLSGVTFTARYIAIRN